jgi:lipopolysaccharide export system permease protein
MANLTMKIFAKKPQLLYSYLATEMLGPFFASFIIMNCVFFLVKLIPFLNFVLELNIGFADFIRLFSYLFPNIFLYSIPMAAMLGVTIGFARLSSDSEILALKASGISIYQILPPVIIVATLIALLTSFISIKLIPNSAVAMKQLSYELLKEKISNGIKVHVFTEALGDVVVYVNKIDKTTGEWSDVWVSDMRGVNNPIVTMASTGEMNSSLEQMMVSIVLRNGSLHKPGNDSAQIVRFDRYQINIPLQLPETKATRQKKSALTMNELLQEAEEEQEDSTNTRKILIEFHKRLVLPVGCLMMSLIGLPLGLQARPGKKAIGIQAGLAIFILYYIIFTFGKDMAEKGILPVWLAMWSPNIFFFGLALFWIFRIANEQPLIPEVLLNFLTKLLAVITIPIKAVYQKTAHKIPHSAKTSIAEKTVHLPMPRTAIKGNSKSMIFHVPTCEDYDCIHCTLEFKDIHIAREAGFEPCPTCKKLIDACS